MVNEAIAGEHIQVIMGLRDMADRPFGVSLTQGKYGPGVLAFFGREESEGSKSSLDSSLGFSKPNEIPFNARIPRMEQLLAGFNTLISGYNPYSKGKSLIFKAEFLDRQNRIEELLTHMSMVPEVLSHYWIRYKQLVNCANEKCNYRNKK